MIGLAFAELYRCIKCNNKKRRNNRERSPSGTFPGVPCDLPDNVGATKKQSAAPVRREPAKKVQEAVSAVPKAQEGDKVPLLLQRGGSSGSTNGGKKLTAASSPSRPARRN